MLSAAVTALHFSTGCVCSQCSKNLGVDPYLLILEKRNLSVFKASLYSLQDIHCYAASLHMPSCVAHCCEGFALSSESMKANGIFTTLFILIPCIKEGVLRLGFISPNRGHL